MRLTKLCQPITLTGLLLMAACSNGPERSPSQTPADPIGPLACRVSSYGEYQQHAWTDLPTLGVHYVFIEAPALDKLPEVKETLAKAGLKVSVLRGKADFATDAALNELKPQLEACNALGVRYLFLSLKGQGIEKNALCARLHKAGDVAKAHGVTLVLETHPELCTNGDVELDTMRRVNHPNVRINFDTGNITFYNKGTTAAAELEKIIDYVATVELKDHSGGYNDWNFPPLGTGGIDFPAVLRVLKAHHFHGPVTIEVEGIKDKPWTESQTRDAVGESVRYVRGLAQFD